MPWLTPPTERAIQCNGTQVEFFRRQRGWTQQELADQAGYSKRLVAKAEASGSLSVDTIEVLAETLSSHSQLVHPEDLTASPKDLAIAFMRAYARYEVDMIDHCRQFLSPDLEGHFPGGPESAPLAGLHKGIEAYEVFVRNFFTIFSRPDKKLSEETMVVTTNGNHAVAVIFERVANDYIPPEAPPGIVVMNFLVSRGKIVSVQHIFDTSLAGQVITKWRENTPGEVDHSKLHYIPVSKTNGQD